jgi:hypothetical protein
MNDGLNREQYLLFVFIEKIATPAMLRYFMSGATGGDFADWMDGGFPDELEQLQEFTHPMMPGLQGVEAIVQGFEHTPKVWTQIMQRGEPAFRQFITEFCAWKPEEEEPAQDVEIVPPASGPIDLDSQEGSSES